MAENLTFSTLSKKQVFDLATAMFIFAFLLRLVISVAYVNRQDTLWYREWALALPDGFWNIYARADEISLDYPPVYLIFLYITGLAYRMVQSGWGIMTDMLFMKFWPIFFDTLCGLALYLIFRKRSGKIGFVAAFLWLFSPLTIFNSAFWGQTDGLMCLLLLISFYVLEENKPVLASVLFAIAGLTKFQCLFFTPVFLIELFSLSGVKNFFKGITAAFFTVLAVFLPFMFGAKNPLLFFDVYLGSSGKYPHCTLNAFNFYGALNLNWVDDSKEFIGNISFDNFSTVITVLLILLMFLTYIYAKNRCVWVISFLFMNSLFMFMTRMHERYAFVTIIFILVAALKNQDRKLFYCFLASSIMSFINHFVPMFSWNDSTSVFAIHYDKIFLVFSIINLFVFIAVTYICVSFLFKNKEEYSI